MKKRIAFIVALLALSIPLLCGCAQSQVQNCNHNYYLADYKDPTASEAGYKKYTCSNCGNTYQEVVPPSGSAAGSMSSDTNSNAANTTPSTEVDLTREKSVNLFELQIYSSHGGPSYNTTKPNYSSSETDSAGWKHEDCYMLACGYDDEWIRYELDGEYSTLKGNIYSGEDYYVVGEVSKWLEFYDGEDFLFSTEKLSDDSPSTYFEYDVKDVQYLTVHLRSTGDGWGYIIADDIILYK